MGNISNKAKDVCRLAFCPNRKEYLVQWLKQDAVKYKVNTCVMTVINERGKRTASFGVVPKKIISQEQVVSSRQRAGFSTTVYSESENDTERDSLASYRSFSTWTSCQIAEYSPHFDEEESAKRVDGTIADGEVADKCGIVQHAKIRRSCMIRSNWCRKSSYEKYSTGRVRRDAILVNTIDPPDRKLFLGKTFFLQNSAFDWERVTVEHWNCWNGTWQVRGEDGISFPAAPIALKNAKDHEFLTRERSIRLRSFNNQMEITPKLVIV